MRKPAKLIVSYVTHWRKYLNHEKPIVVTCCQAPTRRCASMMSQVACRPPSSSDRKHLHSAAHHILCQQSIVPLCPMPRPPRAKVASSTSRVAKPKPEP